MNYQVLAAEEKKRLPPNERRGELIIYKLELGAGDSRFPNVELSQQPQTPAPKVGDKLEGQIEPTDYGPRFKKAGGQSNQGGNRSGGAVKDFKADPAKLRAENARSALHAAVALVNHDKLPLDKLGEYTAKFYDFVERHAKVGE